MLTIHFFLFDKVIEIRYGNEKYWFMDEWIRMIWGMTYGTDDSKVVLWKTLVGSYNTLNIFFSKFILSYVIFTMGRIILTPCEDFVNQTLTNYPFEHPCGTLIRVEVTLRHHSSSWITKLMWWALMHIKGTHQLRKCGCSKVPWPTLFETSSVVSKMVKSMIFL